MTLNKLDSQSGLYFDSQISPIGLSWQEGILAVVVNPVTGVVRYSDVFMLSNSEYWFDKDSERFISMMNWIPAGHVIMLAAQKNAIGPDHNGTLVYEAVERALYCKVGKSRLRNLNFRDAWVAVAVKEQPWRTIERVGRTVADDGFRYASAHLSMPLTNAAFYVETRIHHSESWNHQNRLLAATYDEGVPIVDMAGDVSSWKSDDEIVITSTDFEWSQASLARLEKCDIHHRDITCNDNQVRINGIRKYNHWGEIIHGVDMRAEVGLLSRNVVIRSTDFSETCYDNEGRQTLCAEVGYRFGGQIKIKAGYGTARIEGVRLQYMGQDNNEDAYPIFFDMAGDTNDTAYVRSNAIVDSFRRAVVLKATHYLHVEMNVVYRHAGHGIYLLEGGEKYNIINGNLVLGTFKSPLDNIETREAASYMITNPLTVVTNNVAAGGEAKGFMFAAPPEPVGDSRALNLMARDEASRTPFLLVDNNIGHSNVYSGLDMYRSISDDGTTLEWNSRYMFKSDPLDAESEDVPAYVTRSTMYKNRYENIIARGGWLVFDRTSVADSTKGIQINGVNHQRPYITNSIILGETANIGQPQRCWNGSANVDSPRSCRITWEMLAPVQGIPFIDGPTYVDNVYFNDFIPTEFYTSGALGFVRNNRWWTSPLTAVSNAHWGFQDGALTGNRVFDGMPGIYGFSDLTGDKQSLFRDLDGTVTGYADSTVVKPYPFLYTDSCYYRDNWMLHVCPHRYGKLTLWAPGGGTVREAGTPFMTRDDEPAETLDQIWTTTANFPVILGGDYSYILHFENEMPQELWMTGDGVEKDLWVRVGVCLPPDAVFELYTYVPDWRPRREQWNEVFSVEELDATDVATSYYLDNVTMVVFFKFKNDYSMEPGQMEQCPQGLCPRVRLTILEGTRDQSNCLDRAYPEYTRSAPARKRLVTALQYTDLPETDPEPGENLGAHSTYPFPGVEVPSGHGYLGWGEWSACSETCGGGVTRRERVCDDPQGCNGPIEETEVCNQQACPVLTGEFSEWTSWSACSVSCGGGKETRSRECVSDIPCVGDLTQERDCNLHECPVDGGFTDWSEWSACSASCGGGQQTRQRTCTNPAPAHGGADCVGDASESLACNEDPCPVDGGYTDWSEWSECSATCGGGSQSRERTCTDPAPVHGGADCVGDATETQDCNTEICPVVCVTDPA